MKCSTNAYSIRPQKTRLSRAGGPQVAELDPEIGEDNARAVLVSAAPRKDEDRRRAGLEVVLIAPRALLALHDLAASPTGTVRRTRDDLLVSEGPGGTQT